MLARAVAKGLLGGIVPGESKKGKRGKRRKDHKDPADSKPSSPSSHDGETGNELEDGQDPVYATEHDQGEDEGEDEKKNEMKGRKQKVKRRAKQSATVSRKHPKDKKPAKKKQPSQHRRHLRKRRARKIPRLTLTLMSSAKPSSSLSTMTALAHELSKKVTIESQQMPYLSPRPSTSGSDLSPRPPASLPAVLRWQNTDAGRAEKKVKPNKTGRFSRSKVGSGATGLVLPPISKPSHSSGSRTGRSVSQACDRPPFVFESVVKPTDSVMQKKMPKQKS